MPPIEERRIDLLDHALYENDPQETYTWMRKHAPVYWDETNELWGITRHEDIVKISRTPELFSSAEGSRPNTPGSGSMIDNDDPKHLAFRRIFAKQITPRGVKQFTPRVQRIVDDLFGKLAGKNEFDLVKDLAIPLPVRVILEALGLDDGDWPRYAHIAEVTMGAGGGPRYLTDEVQALAGGFYGEAIAESEKRKAAPGDDWLSLITQNANDGSAARTPVEIAAEALLILNGGSDTTRHVIAGGTLALMQNPEQYALLRAEPDRLAQAIEEMIRWVSPLLNMSRTVTQDCEIRGQQIRKGQQVLLMYAAANRDEAVFEEAQRFDITRDPNPHVSFGIGTHFCMGANIARMELRCLFEGLLANYPRLERAESGPLKISAPAFACGLKTLPVRAAAA